MHTADPLAGAITDGTTNVIVEDGVAVLVTDEGEVHTTHRLSNLLRPSLCDFEGCELGRVMAVTWIGRSAWSIPCKPSTPGKHAHDIVFDAESGVLLCVRTGDSYLGFEELELDEVIPARTFRWSGPVEPRKVGRALVVPEEDGGSFSVHWEVSVRGRSLFHQDGPASVSRIEAVRWGEARAVTTTVRGETD